MDEFHLCLYSLGRWFKMYHKITLGMWSLTKFPDIIVFPTKVEKNGQFELPNGSKCVHPQNVIFVYKICGELQETKQ